MTGDRAYGYNEVLLGDFTMISAVSEVLKTCAAILKVSYKTKLPLHVLYGNWTSKTVYSDTTLTHAPVGSFLLRLCADPLPIFMVVRWWARPNIRK